MMFNQIHNCDCIPGMQEKVDSDSADLIIADPPFAIKFDGKQENYNRKKENVIGKYKEEKVETYDKFSVNWIKQAKRILKDSGSIFIVSGWSNLFSVLKAAESFDPEDPEDKKLTMVNHIIWKYQFGVNCEKRFISSHYHILYYCVKEKERTFNTHCRFNKDDKIGLTKRSARYADMEDVWVIPKENWTGKMKTATKLPGELINKMLLYVGKPGDLVVDPFSGSGQVAWFSKKNNMNYISFEEVEDICNFSRRRIDENKYLIDLKDR